MTTKNEFYPFAGGVGANVLDNDEYEALRSRHTGFVAGTALSIQLNTVWRQAAAIAAMIGQFTADYQDQDVLDDGRIAVLEDQFVRAVKKAVGMPVYVGLTDTGTEDFIQCVCTPEVVKYDIPCLVIFRKRPGMTNTGPVRVDFGAGLVGLIDNTGAPFTAGALLGGAFHICIFDGAGFVLLGGEATYMNVTNLTANSGDMVAVQTTGQVDFRTARGTRSVVFDPNDRWPRGKAVGDDALFATTAEVEAWIKTLFPNIQLGIIGMEAIESSKIWQRPPNVKAAIAFVTAGGGAGGSGSWLCHRTGAGGGAGGTAIGLVDLTNTPTVDCTIGAGGQGLDDGQGGKGGDTKFGTFLTAQGGDGGHGNYRNHEVQRPGLGGIGENGVMNLRGGAGMKSGAHHYYSWGANGGASFWDDGGVGGNPWHHHHWPFWCWLWWFHIFHTPAPDHGTGGMGRYGSGGGGTDSWWTWGTGRKRKGGPGGNGVIFLITLG